MDDTNGTNHLDARVTEIYGRGSRVATVKHWGLLAYEFSVHVFRFPIVTSKFKMFLVIYSIVYLPTTGELSCLAKDARQASFGGGPNSRT